MVHTSTLLDLLLWVGKSSLCRIQWYIPQPSSTSSCGLGSPHCTGYNGTYLNLLGPPPVGGEVLTVQDTMVHTSTFLYLLLWVGKSSLCRIQWYIPQPSWTSSCGWRSPHCAGYNGTYLNLLKVPPVGREVLTVEDAMVHTSTFLDLLLWVGKSSLRMT